MRQSPGNEFDFLKVTARLPDNLSRAALTASQVLVSRSNSFTLQARFKTAACFCSLLWVWVGEALISPRVSGVFILMHLYRCFKEPGWLCFFIRHASGLARLKQTPQLKSLYRFAIEEGCIMCISLAGGKVLDRLYWNSDCYHFIRIGYNLF